MDQETIIETAIKSFAQGKLVALPTETVYGLCAPIDETRLIEKIFQLKSRPHFDPLIVHVFDKKQILPLVKNWSPLCEKLAEHFWPGPLTLVLEKSDLVSDLITAGLPTVGVRIPNSQIGLAFLKKLNRPVAAPSANMFKKISPTKAQDVMDVFSQEDVFVIDGGDCSVGIESTILFVGTNNQIKILRPGIISITDIQEVIKDEKFQIEVSDDKNISAPGQMEEHYRPTKPLFTAFADSLKLAKEHFQNHSPQYNSLYWIELPDDARLAARQLYGLLRKASETSSGPIALYLNTKYLSNESWSGILDRLKKASQEYKILKVD